MEKVVMNNHVYKGEKTKEISFPLGGIGTGCIGLAGNGRLIDWEIFGRPNKRSSNLYSHFSVKAEVDGQVIDARILNSDFQPPYMGVPVRDGALHSGYGFGPEDTTMAGLPHFKESIFTGEFPFAYMDFIDETFPAKVKLTAFNPFIPLNDKDSSIPGALFEVELMNTLDCEVEYSVLLSLTNPHKSKSIDNIYNQEERIHFIKQTSLTYDCNDVEFGDLSIATDAAEVSCQEYWYRGGWQDSIEMYMRDLNSPGRLQNRTYIGIKKEDNEKNDTSTLAAHMKVKAGEKKKVRFVITWNFPNMCNHWNPEMCECDTGQCDNEIKTVWQNYYATLFKDSTKSASYLLNNWKRLYDETQLFKNALFSSTLPPKAIEAISANLSVLKSPTCLRLTDGSFYGFEGCIEDVGCCEGSCTHVWNYQYALPFLFPKLERSMRDLDFKYNQRDKGNMAFRLQLPLGRKNGMRACVDGQMGGVIKAYRDWKICGDDDWLMSNWEAIKNSIEFAWSEDNEDRWDPMKTGVISGRQHHTLDMELFGPSAWLNGFYLAALKAGAEIADHFDEKTLAKEYREIFLKGKKWTDENLFNGDYFVQRIELEDETLLDHYDEMTKKAYWNDEAVEIKYQIKDGCVIDQVIGQWHANLCGLGEIFDKKKTKTALGSLYKNNYVESMRHQINPWRLYALNDESGLIICSWPDGRGKPAIPLTYNTETMTGFEYQAASHMIQEGLLDEGISIIEAIRDRYDGEKRNPWNEIECGSNYARSMASYALLNTFSGFEFDMVKGMIGFNPIELELTDRKYSQFFWSLDSGWGIVEVRDNQVILKLLYGSLSFKMIHLPFLNEAELVSVKLGEDDQLFTYENGAINFKEELIIEANDYDQAVEEMTVLFKKSLGK